MIKRSIDSTHGNYTPSLFKYFRWGVEIDYN